MNVLLITIDFPGLGVNRSGGGLVALRLARSLSGVGVRCGLFNGDTGGTLLGRVERRDWNGLPTWSVAVGTRANPETLKAGFLAKAFKDVFQDFQPDVIHILQYECWNGLLAPVLGPPGLPVVFTALDYGPFCTRSTLVQGNGTLCDGNPCKVKCGTCLSTGRTPQVHWARMLGKVLPGAAQRLPFVGSLAREAQGNRQRLEETLAHWLGLLNLVSAWIAPSKAMKDMLLKEGVDASKLAHVPYGFDGPGRRPIKSDDAKVVFGYAGRPIYEKGFHLLARAFAEAAARHPHIRLRLFGSREQMAGSYPAKALQILRPVEDRIEWAAFEGSDDADISRAQAEIHAMVVPSIWRDNLPLTVIESLANGTPVIASSHSSAAEPIKEGVNGLLFRYDETASLTRVIGTFASSPELRQKLFENTRYRRSAAAEARDVMDVYQKVCGPG